MLDEGNKHCYDPTTAKTAIYGLPGDKPVVSNWAGGVVDQVGVFRGNRLWIGDNLGLGTWSPATPRSPMGWPAIIRWLATGLATPAVRRMPRCGSASSGPMHSGRRPVMIREPERKKEQQQRRSPSRLSPWS